MMKKIVVLASVILFSTNLAKAQEENQNQFENSSSFEEQLLNKEDNNIDSKIATENFATVGEAIAVFLEEFAKIAAMGKVCMEEDKKMAPMTQQDAENIVKLIAPNNINDFTINLEAKNLENFAKGNFILNQSQITMQLAKSYCLLMSKEMTNSLVGTMNKLGDKISQKMSNDAEMISQNQSIDNIKNSSKITIIDDEINISKFTPLNVNNFEGMKAIDKEKTSAYAFVSVGQLGMHIKAFGGNYDDTIEQLLQTVDVQHLLQMLGGESSAEIRARLNSSFEKEFEEMKQKMKEKQEKRK